MCRIFQKQTKTFQQINKPVESRILQCKYFNGSYRHFEVFCICYYCKLAVYKKLENEYIDYSGLKNVFWWETHSINGNMVFCLTWKELYDIEPALRLSTQGQKTTNFERVYSPVLPSWEDYTFVILVPIFWKKAKFYTWASHWTLFIGVLNRLSVHMSFRTIFACRKKDCFRHRKTCPMYFASIRIRAFKKPILYMYKFSDVQAHLKISRVPSTPTHITKYTRSAENQSTAVFHKHLSTEETLQKVKFFVLLWYTFLQLITSNSNIFVPNHLNNYSGKRHICALFTADCRGKLFALVRWKLVLTYMYSSSPKRFHTFQISQ